MTTSYAARQARVEQIADAIRPARSSSDYDGLLDEIGNAGVVLIGEASHGTEEFYRERALITQRLIEERDFAAVAVEADWPDAYRVNTFVRGEGSAPSPERALGGFERFPTWMWRNTVVVDFIEWLRMYNGRREIPERMAGFYGIDLYSLYRSIEAVIGYLDRVDPEAGRRARQRYSCFDETGDDAQAYGYAAAFDLERSCEEGAIEQLLEIYEHSHEFAKRDGRVPEDDLFEATQNARVVKNAEEYYRQMFGSRVSTWNLRDQHMGDTIWRLREHLAERRGDAAKVVVWAHNSHLGDARATEMGQRGELNVGQLTREMWGEDSFSIGFTTHHGTVTAASDWGEDAERKRVRPGLDASWEDLFHRVAEQSGEDRFWLPLRDGSVLEDEPPRLERAIGVIYRPQTERLSHYFRADLARQFDAVIHLDETTALEPLERTQEWASGEAPETYPFAE